MKKLSFLNNITLMCFACGGIVQHTSAQLTVTENTHLVASGAGTQIVLQSLGLVNDGTFNHTAGNVQITGNGVYAIAGSGPLSFYNLEMNKSANYIILSRNIAVKNQLKFTAGILRLNNYDIDLVSTGVLVNETEASRITSVNTGKVKTTAILNAPNAANPGNLGAVFTSTENFGSVSIERGHQSQINDQGTGTSILRYYEITPTNNAALKATLRFNYFDAELNGIIESNLVLFKGSANGSWIEKGYTIRDATLNYVEKTNNPDFSRWTLSNTGNVLASGCPGGVPTQNYYADVDGDGYGNPNSIVAACVQPLGYVINKTDCNDNNALIHPGATEICNGIDDDCDGQTDEGVQTVYYPDVDGDGYGNTAASVKACSPPVGYITTGGDCNDNNANVHPGATEICGNFIDDDCDGQVDEGCPASTASISINDLIVNESQGTAQLTVILSSPSANTIKVSYRTANGTASHPKDYTRKTGDIVFAPGATSQIITISIVADNKAEPDEYFEVQLHTPQGAIISDGNGRVTITEALLTKTSQSKRVAEIEESGSKSLFDVRVSSNPTNTQFRLQVETNDEEEKIILQVTDLQGRVIERLQANHPFQPIYLGANYRSGTYFVRIVQGVNRKTVKLIKL